MVPSVGLLPHWSGFRRSPVLRAIMEALSGKPVSEFFDIFFTMIY